jgi:hypothetical protein
MSLKTEHLEPQTRTAASRLRLSRPTATEECPRSPSRSELREALITLAVFGAALGLYALDWSPSPAPGVSTVGAERVLRGETPDFGFWTTDAPGHFYLLALLFWIFGTHPLVEVVSASVICAAAACLCSRLIFSLVERRLAALACAGVFVAATYYTECFKSLGSYPPAILYVFLALGFTVAHFQTGRFLPLAAADLATGVTAAFKHDLGAYTTAAIAASLVFHDLLASRWAQAGVGLLPAKLVLYVSGVAVIAVPVLTYFAAVAGTDLFANLLVFPLTGFRFARHDVGLRHLAGCTVLRSVRRPVL